MLEIQNNNYIVYIYTFYFYNYQINTYYVYINRINIIMTTNMKPTEITIGKNKYYNADELKSYDLSYFLVVHERS